MRLRVESRDFKRFEFLGFYTGDLLEFEDGKSPRGTTNQYTYAIDDSSWIRPSRRTMNKNQHPRQYAVSTTLQQR